MKKKYYLCLLLFLSICSFVSAKSAPMPAWVTDYRSIFPDSEYIAQRGTGESAEKAITDAASSLARYFQMSVNANISTTMTEEKTTVVDEVQVKSDVELFGMQFTEPYHIRKEKKWYVMAYIKRNDAWIQYKPRIEQKRKTFIGLYSNIEREEDSFSKLALCGSAWEAGKEFLTCLEYGRILAPDKEAYYLSDRDKIARIPVLEAEAKNSFSIYVELSDDYNNLLNTAISSSFTKAGFPISKNRAAAKYVCTVAVDDNTSGSEPLVISPSLSISIAGKNGKSVYTYEYASEARSVSYTLENARKKGYPAFAKEVEKSLVEDLNNILKQ